jgi:hypothetical protein
VVSCIPLTECMWTEEIKLWTIENRISYQTGSRSSVGSTIHLFISRSVGALCIAAIVDDSMESGFFLIIRMKIRR